MFFCNLEIWGRSGYGIFSLVRRDVGTSGWGEPDTENCRLGRQGIFVDFTLGHMWNFIVGCVSEDAVNFHFDTCGICLLKTKFSLAREEMEILF